MSAVVREMSDVNPVIVFAIDLPDTGASEGTIIGIAVTAAVLLILGVGAALLARARRKTHTDD
jgi:LPXTG-motif cell wall-anchored protein